MQTLQTFSITFSYFYHIRSFFKFGFPLLLSFIKYKHRKKISFIYQMHFTHVYSFKKVLKIQQMHLKKKKKIGSTPKSTCKYRKLMTWALSVPGDLKYYDNYKHYRLIFNIEAHAFITVFLFNFNFLLNGCHLSVLKLSNIIGSDPSISLLNRL